MSRSSYAPRETYTGTGSVAAYAFSFKIEALAQLEVVEYDDSDVETQRVRGDDAVYLSSVDFDAVAGGGIVNLAANLTNNYKLVLLLANDAPTQEHIFKELNSFTLKRIEAALDFIAGAVMRTSYLAQRGTRVPDLYLVSAFDPTLPKEITDAESQSIVTNAAGTGFDIGPSLATINGAVAAAAAAAASEAAAATSEANAATSEANAATSASNAATSETNASNSASAAATSETNAATSETNASTSETNAATSETNAGLSETAAAASETNASTSETNAATSETNAATSETNAATSASNAATSETNAAASAAAAAVAWSAYQAHNITAGQAATFLSAGDGEDWLSATYTTVLYDFEIIRGTTLNANGTFKVQKQNGTWRIKQESYLGEVHGVTWSLTGTTTQQLNAAVGAGDNGVIKLSRKFISA